MAEFNIDGRMKVKKLKELFKNEYQGTLRVYNKGKLADDDATLSSIRSNDGAKGGVLTCKANRTVGKFEEEMWNVFGIKVQVASPDDWVLALDSMTLSKLKDIPNNARKADMESLIGYKRVEGNQVTDKNTSESVKNITVRIQAQAMLLRLCVVKEPEELKDIFDEDHDEAIELINDQIGSEDNEFFEEELYDWYIMRGEDVDEHDIMITTITDENEEVIYEGPASDFLSDHNVNLEGIEADEEYEEGGDINIGFLKNLSVDDENFDNYRNLIIEQQEFCMNQFPLVRKHLTGSFYPEDDDIYYAGNRFIKDICFDYNIEIPSDESFDIKKFKLLMDYSTCPDFMDYNENEEEWGVEYALYGNKIIRGELQFDSNVLGEPIYTYMIKDSGFFEKIFSVKSN